ncbi:MAG TPA: hypothetical protein VNW51_01230, partial [Mucilaginibacter sp.]|nr:hypothetical protein [Mucilaginibacter sp.]
ENIAFRDKFLSSICVKIKYEFEKSNGLVITVSDKQYRKALKFLAQYVDLKQPAYVWHEWYNNNKCNNLK